MFLGQLRARALAAAALSLLLAACGSSIFSLSDAGPGHDAGSPADSGSPGDGGFHCGTDSDCSPPILVCNSGECAAGCFQTGCPSGFACSGSSGRCDPSLSTNDAGSSGYPDAGSGGSDAGSSGSDAGSSGNPDAGSSGSDAGSGGNHDAGSGGSDAGSGGNPDAGSGGSDAGSGGNHDAGSGGSDAGSSGNPDAGSQDAGTGEASSTLCHSCENDGQCAGNGLCISDSTHTYNYCTQDCSTSACPPDFVCATASNGSSQQCVLAGDNTCANNPNNPSGNGNGGGRCASCAVNQDCVTGAICSDDDSDAGSGICELSCDPNNTLIVIAGIPLYVDCATPECVSDIENDDLADAINDCFAAYSICGTVSGSDNDYCIAVTQCPAAGTRGRGGK